MHYGRKLDQLIDHGDNTITKQEQGAMDQIETETVDGTPISITRHADGTLYINNERVGTITNTPLGVILMCAQRGYTIDHPTYFRVYSLGSNA